MPSVIILSVILLSVVILSVFVLSVVTPKFQLRHQKNKIFGNFFGEKIFAEFFENNNKAAVGEEILP